MGDVFVRHRPAGGDLQISLRVNAASHSGRVALNTLIQAAREYSQTAPGGPLMAETVSDASVYDGRPLSRCRLAVAPDDRAFAISGHEPPIPVA
jgi:hypothetical protein